MQRSAPLVTAIACGLLSAQDWRPSYPATDPGARIGTNMAFDAARGELVLFGGRISPNPADNATWTWNGATWTQRSPAASPTARQSHAMCYDSLRSRVVLYGGLAGTGALADTWEWDGANWTQRNPAASPPARYWPVVVFDGAHTVLFGGGNSAQPRNDTWTYDGATWAQVTTANAPSPRYYQSMASNGAGEVLLFGGFDPMQGYLGDTWTWNGSNWSAVTSAAAPGARGRASTCYDSQNGRYLLCSGTDSFFAALEDTWAFAGGQWTQLTTQRSPSSRGAGGAAWFAPRNRFVVYSADYLSSFDLKSTPMWEFGSGLASFVRWGPSVCPAIDPPVLRAHQSQPAPGTAFQARVDSFSWIHAFVLVGLSTTSWSGGPLPYDLVAFGTWPNCLLRVRDDTALYLGFGQSQPWTLNVPNQPGLLGVTFHLQGFTFGAGSFPTNLSTANAATLVIGAN